MSQRLSCALPLAFILAASACDSPSREVTDIVPAPDLSSAAPSVREQLDAARESAIDVASSDTATAEERADAWGLLAEHYHAYEFHEAAASCYERARRLAPAEARWAYLAGILAQQRGDPEAAVRALQEARRLEPNDPAIALRLGEVQLRLEQWNDAEALLQQAAQETGLAAAAKAALGRMAVSRGDHTAAVGYFRGALERQPDADLLYLSLARSLQALGRADEATAARAHAGQGEVRRSEPVLAEVLARRRGTSQHLLQAGKQAASGDLEGAEQTYRRALSQTPDSLEAMKGLAGVLLARGTNDEAEALLRQVLARDPADTDAHLRLAHLLELKSDLQAALAEYRRAVETAADESMPRLALAAALHRSGSLADAIRQYDSVLHTSPADRRALLGRIQALADAQRLAEAQRDLETFVERHPEDLGARLLAAQLLARSGEFATAERAFQSILDARNVDAPTAARAHHGLGNLLAQQGRWPEAEAALRQALELDPGLDTARAALRAVLLETGGPPEVGEAARQTPP